MDSTDWPAHVFGRARFERFEKIAGGDTQAALELYLGEQEEALDVFLVLSLLEVGLRNVVCAALERQGQPWYEVLSELLKGESAHLLESKKKVAAEHQRDRLIASLTFGFWCSLFFGPTRGNPLEQVPVQHWSLAIRHDPKAGCGLAQASSNPTQSNCPSRADSQHRSPRSSGGYL